MARQRYYHDPARKHIETYQDFSGGLNVVSSNDNIQDTELVKLINADLGDRGSLSRRKGYETLEDISAMNYALETPQMIAKYYRHYTPHNLLGIDGSFNVRRTSTNTQTKIGGWYSFNVPPSSFRLEKEGENSYIAIDAKDEDNTRIRGVGLRFTGVKPNTYYIYVVRYKSDGVGTGRILVRDERYGIYPFDESKFFEREINFTHTEWQTYYMVFKAYPGMTRGRAYVYNYSPTGTESTVYYDDARIYEITAKDYEEIEGMTYDEIAEKYPYLTGRLTHETYEETITAIGGKFYVNGVEYPVEDDLDIQDSRIMDAVNYGNELYIASGSGLLVYNGSTISKVTPYIPDPLETLYIGSNALIEGGVVVSDEEQSIVELLQIRFSDRYGTTNRDIEIEVGVGKPGGTAIEYLFERRNVLDRENDWTTIKDWSMDNHTTFKTSIAGEYQFRVSIRKRGETDVLDDYVIPRYIIKPTQDNSELIDAGTIDLCNRILVHWDRLILYGDEAKQDVIYISDLQNPSYFPVNNSLWFENPRKEKITSIVPYRDTLVVFTPSSTQALFGTNPEDYKRVMLNPHVGCISERGAQAVQNHLIFPSYEGIVALKSVGVSETRANIDILDTNIKSLVRNVTNSVAYVRNNQYCLVYPDTNEQLRFYYDWGVWTKDESPIFDFAGAFVESERLYALGKKGNVVTNSNELKDDAFIFPAHIKTKNFFFGESYAIKKTREVQVMFDTPEHDTKLDIIISTDNNVLRQDAITLLANEEVYKVMMAGKGLFVNVELVHTDDKPFRFDGLGFIFKLKNP